MGLQSLMPAKKVARHRGKAILGATFAVAKNEEEDRIINDPAVNDLLDGSKLPRPKFSYMPALRVMKTRRGKILRVSKRDARHYFHKLRIGRKWKPYLAMPSADAHTISKEDRVHPAHNTAPMGFGPSAGWAQALTDYATSSGGLPDDRRLKIDDPAPATPPSSRLRYGLLDAPCRNLVEPPGPSPGYPRVLSNSGTE